MKKTAVITRIALLALTALTLSLDAQARGNGGGGGMGGGGGIPHGSGGYRQAGGQSEIVHGGRQQGDLTRKRSREGGASQNDSRQQTRAMYREGMQTGSFSQDMAQRRAMRQGDPQ